MGQFDLESALFRPCTSPEDFKDQAGAVDDLCAPGLLEIALLYRAERAIHDDETDLLSPDQPGQFLDLAAADESGRSG
jgi:hypothetical protein